MLDHDISLQDLIDEMYDYALYKLDDSYKYAPHPASTAIDQSYNFIIHKKNLDDRQALAIYDENEE